MAQVERHVAAHGEKATVHLRARRTRLGTGGSVFGPQVRVGELFCQVFSNRQGVGDGSVFGFQQRDLAGRRMLEQTLAGVRLVQFDQFFGVGGASQIEGQSPAQGPGGMQFVADDQVQAHVRDLWDEGDRPV
ncbi:hypothetical protein D9M69_646250 [compost metagenome]